MYLLFYLVPQSTSLVSSVILGDYVEVERQLKILTKKYTTESSEDQEPKKPNVIMGLSEETDEVSMDTTTIESPSNDNDQPDPALNMNIDADAIWDRDESGDVGLNRGSLYECTAQNCNILHTCAGSDGVEVEDDKSGFVGYVGEFKYTCRFLICFIHVHVRRFTFGEVDISYMYMSCECFQDSVVSTS